MCERERERKRERGGRGGYAFIMKENVAKSSLNFAN